MQKMKRFRWITYVLYSMLETLIRFFPVSSKPGIRTIGQPNEFSPVFLTVNYHLTVLKLMKVLRNMDCYLLVADTKGINVWCAAAGGHLNNHSVISILKTTNIENLVNHKEVILPQLAATGIEPAKVSEKTGWKIIWGPIYAEDIHLFIKSNYSKKKVESRTHFKFLERIEMAVAWSFPISILVEIIVLIFWINEWYMGLILSWMIPLMIFVSFPLYSNILSEYEKSKIQIYLYKFLVILCFNFVVFLPLTYLLIRKTVSFHFFLRWNIMSLLLVISVIMELKGTTPIYKSDTHDNKDWIIKINLDKCRGIGVCIDVCPRDCYQMNKNTNRVNMVNSQLCIKCGACVVQCPCDAIYFQDKDGNKISPETTRKFKLNLMGKQTTMS